MVLDTLSHLLAPRLSVRNVIQTVGPLAACAAVQSWTRGYKCEESRNVHNKTFIMIVSCRAGPSLASTSLANCKLHWVLGRFVRAWTGFDAGFGV